MAPLFLLSSNMRVSSCILKSSLFPAYNLALIISSGGNFISEMRSTFSGKSTKKKHCDTDIDMERNHAGCGFHLSFHSLFQTII